MGLIVDFFLLRVGVFDVLFFIGFILCLVERYDLLNRFVWFLW